MVHYRKVKREEWDFRVGFNRDYRARGATAAGPNRKQLPRFPYASRSVPGCPPLTLLTISLFHLYLTFPRISQPHSSHFDPVPRYALYTSTRRNPPIGRTHTRLLVVQRVRLCTCRCRTMLARRPMEKVKVKR